MVRKSKSLKRSKELNLLLIHYYIIVQPIKLLCLDNSKKLKGCLLLYFSELLSLELVPLLLCLNKQLKVKILISIFFRHQYSLTSLMLFIILLWLVMSMEQLFVLKTELSLFKIYMEILLSIMLS
jgi:hypothetical protein